MDSRRFGTDRLTAQLLASDAAMSECRDRLDVATDDAKIQLLGDLADALRERHARIQRRIASVRSKLGLAPEQAAGTEECLSDWADLHVQQRLAAGL